MRNKCVFLYCYFVLSGRDIFKPFYLGFASPYPSPLPANGPDVLRKVTIMMLHLESDEIGKIACIGAIPTTLYHHTASSHVHQLEQ